ncbi:T9SS type A sorting domain-containing protein [Aquiflexum sp. AIY15W]|nr:T9SS type A sorting domain-containing protein [Cognataquiflexum rubidum]
MSPLLSVSNIAAVSNEFDKCGATVSFSASSIGTAPISIKYSIIVGGSSVEITSPYFFPVGSTNVTATATNACGNDSKTFTVTVTDAQKPVITTNGDKDVNVDPGACSAVVAVSATAADNCSVGAPAGVRSDGLPLTDPYLEGITTITWNVSDVNGNSATAVTQTVTVVDNVDPVAIAQDITVQLDANGNATITAAMIDNGSNDACGIASLVLDITSFDCSNVGPNTVTLTVTDNNGNESTATATVTVEDNVDPVAIAQDITVQLDANGNATITAAMIDNGSNDACGIASLVLDITSFDCSNVGPNTVTLTVTDNNGNESTATATVTVEDNTIPIWTTPINSLDKSVVCGQNQLLADAQALEPIAVDNCGYTLSKTSGVFVPSGAPGGSGSYTNTWIATDPSSNQSIEFKQVITVESVSIDALASSTPVPMNQAATLKATVTPNEAGVSVTFVVTNEANTEVYTNTVLTNSSGFATATTGNLTTIGVYKVTATVGTGCASSTAYIPVYDASGSFVTGGGWINSPAGALVADESLVGKANFGFVSRYRKGSSQVDGNTEFQFHAGSLNFKSTMHESGSLVISGKRATYRGTGTINGQSGFKFVVVAIDGNWNGQSNPDAFRIKISTTTDLIIYDNQMGSDENTENATILGNNGTGGGSIVIHEAKSGTRKRIDVSVQEVPWNTPIETLEKQLNQMSKGWFEGNAVAIKWDSQAYDPLAEGFYQVDGFVQNVDLDEMDEVISVPVMVLNKPMARDIVLESNVLPNNVQEGQVISLVSTIDPADNIHTYSMDEHPNLQVQDNQLIWKGNSISSEQMRFTIHSTDRAGQTISREITLMKDLAPNTIMVYPNPASEASNIQVNLVQASEVTLRVFDAAGRVVMEEQSYQERSFVRPLDLKGLSNGLYHVVVQVGNQVMTKRLVKQ